MRRLEGVGKAEEGLIIGGDMVWEYKFVEV